MGAIDAYVARAQVERAQKWRQWVFNLPMFSFPFPVSIIPPFGGALIRFQAGPKREVSVYLDVNDSLGAMGEPYWEIYPDEDGDTRRFYLEESDQMIDAVSRAIVARQKRKEDV